VFRGELREAPALLSYQCPVVDARGDRKATSCSRLGRKDHKGPEFERQNQTVGIDSLVKRVAATGDPMLEWLRASDDPDWPRIAAVLREQPA